MKLFFTCHSGAEKTRGELRKQVYDAMAEEARTGAGKPESEDGKGNTEVKKENGVAESPVKHDVNGSEEPSSSLVNGKEISIQKVNKVGKSAPVNGIGESSNGSPGKETVTKEVASKEQNGEKTEEKPEAEEDSEEPEGSKSWTEHSLC